MYHRATNRTADCDPLLFPFHWVIAGEAVKVPQEVSHLVKLGLRQAQLAQTGVWNSSVFCPLINAGYLHIRITWGSFQIS